ncbi:F-box domain protein [Penicillium chermesinum]|uniref:F-box domain protein n=1 Tax=Penicillium chermesinum TaxID=63820 RepID=A0A9W9TB09_9EURO|nr:F-box domain protein [Penicillium chermesinum]KAJ5215030.1 F-box domain protein [Penicillium chermesinum]KAJ6141471.1 F-box domain protein [Penicillium chermesinum]
MNIPDEILVAILDFATLNKNRPCPDACHQKRDYESARTLTLVSKRFRRIATPLMFEEIRFESHRPSMRFMVPPSRAVQKLHQLLQANPSLRPLCHTLRAEIDDTAHVVEEDFQIINDFISWFSNLRDLTLVGGFYSSTSDVVRDNALALVGRTRELTKVKNLHVEGSMWYYETGGITLAEAANHINVSSLKGLEITAAGLSDPSTISDMLTPDKIRSAPFTSLKLKGCKDYPEAIAAMIHWPRELVHFAINTSGSFVSDMSLVQIGRCLAVHKETLKNIYIDLLGFPHGLSFRACDFPYLETLRLSRTQICEDPRNRNFEWKPEYADLLLGPQLHTFGLVFGVMGHSLINNWGSMEEEWIRQLAKAASERGSALRAIEINFSPVNPYPNLKQGVYSEWEYVYPWDRMDQLGAEILQYGVTLRYTPPPWTKEEWLNKTLWHGSLCACEDM